MYQIESQFTYEQAKEKPISKDTSILKQALSSLTGRKNHVDASASLLDYMYFFPNRQASVKQLRSETFKYLAKSGKTTEVLKAPVYLIEEIRSLKLQYGYKLA